MSRDYEDPSERKKHVGYRDFVSLAIFATFIYWGTIEIPKIENDASWHISRFLLVAAIYLIFAMFDRTVTNWIAAGRTGGNPNYLAILTLVSTVFCFGFPIYYGYKNGWFVAIALLYLTNFIAINWIQAVVYPRLGILGIAGTETLVGASFVVLPVAASILIYLVG
jgi:hypothetical protein